jgi:5-methylcytosine-specific restriction enzyme A
MARLNQMPNRPGATERGYNYRWQRESKHFLWQHPLCARCEQLGRHQLAEVVDHVQPHRGDPGLFWDQANWQTLCKVCHDKKTLLEQGKQCKPKRKIGVDGYPIG